MHPLSLPIPDKACENVLNISACFGKNFGASGSRRIRALVFHSFGQANGR